VKRLPKNPHLKTLEQALADRFGWQPGLVRDQLVAAASSKADRLGLDVVSYCRMAAASSGELQALAEEVAIGETRFFRESEQFEALRDRVLADVLAARASARRARFWSVACSTGEEPYSLALLVRDALPPDEEWRVELFASDLRGNAIMSASRGRYRAAALRRLWPGLRDRYFIGIDEPGPNREFELIPLVRRMVTFRRANVCEPHVWRQIPGPYDLIVCENLLVYFHRLAVEQTVERLVAALAPGGILMVSPAEASLVSRAGLRAVEVLPRGFFVRPAEAR
jgi:chemotaxis methyl-accepting protein methylase